MSFFFPFIISFVAGFATVLGTIPIFFKWSREGINKFITLSLALSLTIMIGISVTELIPEASFYILTEYKIVKGTCISIMVFILSIMLMLILSKKINKKEKGLYYIGILSMITLIIHNLPEGIITFFSAQKSTSLGIKICLAILLHNIPEGISIAIPIYFSTGNKKKAIFYTIISGLAEPAGAILAYLILQKIITNAIIGCILIIASGLMITLSIHDLLPKSKSYHEEKALVTGIIIGLIFIIIGYL